MSPSILNFRELILWVLRINFSFVEKFYLDYQFEGTQIANENTLSFQETHLTIAIVKIDHLEKISVC